MRFTEVTKAERRKGWRGTENWDRNWGRAGGGGVVRSAETELKREIGIVIKREGEQRETEQIRSLLLFYSCKT